uniref:ATP synthase subunit a n=1 Tax=Tuber umbilicatum TaxID=691171 RepID=A0A8F6D9E2_9PEZI|nr:ATP synthase F0 subunit a [Tuber umbilicatum]
MDQFEVRNLLSLDVPLLGNINMSITNIGLYLIIGVLIVLSLNLFATNNNKIVSNNWSISQESIYATIHSIVVSQINAAKGQIYFPFIYSLFIFILINNLLGMVPYSFASTSHFILTFSISFTIVLGATLLGFQKHGLGFFSLFVPAGCPLALVPLLVLVELISYIARAVSLGLRLSANIMSGHMLLVILSSLTFTIMSSSFVFFLLGLFPLSFILAFSGLEIAVSIIQAQVFVILTSSYIKDSLFLHSDSSAKPGLSSKVNLNRKVSLPYLEWGRRLYSSAQNSQHFVSGIRSYSTEVNSQSFKLTPFWVTGFCDACLRSRWNQSYLHKSSHSTMSLVVWGTNLTSSVGSGRFSKQVSNMVKLPPHEYSIVIGLLLSDGWLIMPNPHSKNARLGFAQSGAHSAYFWSVFCSLAHYCSSFPTVRNRTRFDKKTIELQFFTRSLPWGFYRITFSLLCQ